MTEIVRYTVNGHEHEAEKNASLLGELRKNGYEVPSLCYLESLTPYGACRLCLVEVKKGKRQRLTTSCNYPVQAGIEVHLDTEKVQRNRRMVLELLLAQAPKASRELHAMAERYGARKGRFHGPASGDEKCILCGLCARACTEGLGADALTFAGRGDTKRMVTPYDAASPACVGCGACARICPTGAIALEEQGGTRTIWGKTFTLARCPACGGTLLPPEQIDLLVKRSGLSRSYFESCETCRRRDTADRFKAVMEP
jgi:NADH dehydrogenase/NADH:ubiquinone oxidoreductase subunit G